MHNKFAGDGAAVGPASKPRPRARTLAGAGAKRLETAFGQPRNSLNNRFVYAVISQRARGLSVGVNLSPTKRCNFDCVYCEVNREDPILEPDLDLQVLAAELEGLLGIVAEGKLREFARFRTVPAELLQLREVALSGDGEPTLCPDFASAVATVVQIRQRGKVPPFKIVLITNGTGLDRPGVWRGIKLLGPRDEIWAKLDAGTQAYMDRINRPQVPLSQVMTNLELLGKRRPIIIQSLFPLIDGHEPPAAEIEQYIERLRELKAAGTQIELVQVYSAHRPPHWPNCEHLPLKTLSFIARRVREATGLRAEVF